MTPQADHCIHCKKPDKPPAIQSYYGVNGIHWAHPPCEYKASPTPETTFAAHCDLQSGGGK